MGNGGKLMLYEITRANGTPLIFKETTKERKNEYEIVVHISLIKNGDIDKQYDRKISIEEFELNLFEILKKLNEDELDDFEKSRKYIRRVK